MQHENTHIESISSTSANTTDQKGQKMAKEPATCVQGQNVERACCIAQSYLLNLCAVQAAFATAALCTIAWCRRGRPCYSIHQMKSLRPTSLQERTPCSLSSKRKALHKATPNPWLKGHRMGTAAQNGTNLQEWSEVPGCCAAKGCTSWPGSVWKRIPAGTLDDTGHSDMQDHADNLLGLGLSLNTIHYCCTQAWPPDALVHALRPHKLGHLTRVQHGGARSCVDSHKLKWSFGSP